jgi:alpha-glucosidase
MVYLPFAYSVDGTFVVVTESDVRDYPVWNLISTDARGDGAVRFASRFAGWPKKTQRVAGWGKELVETGGRWVRVDEHEAYLTETDGTRLFPWRTFVLADQPAKVCESDIVRALAAPQADMDFSWVKPGKVAWDWWNCFDNQGDTGCNTKTYERFIDFAAKTGVEYVIFDEGWSEKLNIWKFHPDVDVPHLIDYANKKGVGIILWMAWAQTYGEEERVAAHFAKLGAKGFKVDFMDRGDARSRISREVRGSLREAPYAGRLSWRLSPVGMQRKYPNIVNYEGIHGLEQMKWFKAERTLKGR